MGVLFALFLLGAAVAAPLTERALVARARERGVLLSARDVDAGLSRVRLRQVRATLVGVPDHEIRLEQVDVRVRLWGLSWSRIEVQGGRIEMAGSWPVLVERLSAWRRRHSPAKPGEQRAAKAKARAVVVSKLSAELRLAEDEKVHVSGLAFEDLGSGPARAGADRVTYEGPGLGVDAAGFECGVSSGPSGFSLSFLRAAEMRISRRLQAEAPVPASAAAAPGAPTKAAPSAGLAERWVTYPERAIELRAALALVRRVARERLPPVVTVERLWLGLERGRERLAVGPSRLQLRRSESALEWSLLPLERARGTPLELAGRLPIAEDQPVTVRLRGGPVTFSQLGVQEGDFGLAAVAGSTLEGQADVELAADATRFVAAGSWSLENLALRVERLASDAILVPRVSARGTLRAAVDGSSFELEGGELTIGQARFDGRVQIARQDGKVLVDSGLRAPLVSCQALLDSAPRALLGAVADMQWSGTFSLDAAVRADSSALGKMGVVWKFDNGCRVTAVPAPLDPERFRGPFSLEVVGADGALQTLEFGPGTASFVHMDDISPYMEAALLVTEDGRFFKHDGFDDRAIESAIVDNVRAGTFVRGASTLSMQLAKNLYLSRTKTLSRKLQEAALTMLLEQNFSKRELLELYLNVVEFGPGIYGVGPAASYYFGQTARDLSPAQAFFLASLLPAPTVQHFAADGRLSASRLRHVQSLLRISHQRGRLSADELARALLEEPRFGVKESRAAEAASAESGAAVETPAPQPATGVPPQP